MGQRFEEGMDFLAPHIEPLASHTEQRLDI